MNDQARKHAVGIVGRVLNRGAFSNVLLAKISDSPELATEQRRRVTALTLGTLRNCLLLDRLLRESADGKWRARPVVRTAGLLGAFEIVFSEKTPSYAAVNEYVKIARAKSSRGEAAFLNACLRRVAETEINDFLNSIDGPVERLATETSHPLWLAESFIRHYGKEVAERLLRAANTPLPLYLRANLLRTERNKVVESLKKDGINASASASPPECIAIAAGEGKFPKDVYDDGLVTPQDRSTQFAPHFLSPAPGGDALDLCCGAGIKTTHIAEIMRDSGRVVAVDVSDAKIRSLKKQCLRLGLTSVSPVAADVLENPSLGSFGRVMIDVPCSGSGVLRRRPEIKLRIQREDTLRLPEFQFKLLNSAAGYVDRGGFLLYSTCSLLPEENEHVVRRFLNDKRDFKIVNPLTHLKFSGLPSVLERGEGAVLIPHELDACGIFAALLERSASNGGIRGCRPTQK